MCSASTPFIVIGFDSDTNPLDVALGVATEWGVKTDGGRFRVVDCSVTTHESDHGLRTISSTISSCAADGLWVLISNANLLNAACVEAMENCLALAASDGHPDFRCIIVANPVSGDAF